LFTGRSGLDRWALRDAPRRVVDEGNAIGTAYLRAQTIAEAQRSESLTLLRQFTDTSIDIAETVPGRRD
jgi:hypothetical protein